MPRNGSGTYTPPPSNPVSPGTVIESDWANDTVADISQALTQSISVTGETVPINNLPMGGFHHVNVSDPVARNQYATLGMVQDGRHQRVNITGGVDNLIGTLVGGGTAYVAGSLISFYAPAANTGPMTLNYNGIGAKSLISSDGLQLVAGDVVAGDFLVAIYDGSQFKLFSQVQSTTPTDALTANTTGQERPPGGAYPALTIATGSTVNVPAGTAWIVPPGGTTAVEVTWAAQTIALQFLASAFSTTIAVDDTGTIVQFPGRMLGANLRNYARLGVVVHITGAAATIATKPAIFADDGYRGTDTASLLGNSLINGGKVTPNSVAVMQLDISGGSIFMTGGSANTIDNPNIYTIFQQSNIQFRTLAGQNTLGAVISNAPVTSYDPNGAGIVTVLPNNNDTVIHRLYYMYGSFIWVYGQIIYSSVENASSFIEYDRSQYRPSQFLQDAVLVAEIIARKSAISLSVLADAAVVAPGGINFSIGTPGGIAEAPIDGTPYGRQNASWVQVLRSISPQISTDATITGPAPMINEVRNPLAAGTSGLRVKAGVNNWFGLEVTDPDDKAYLRSYNPANGALRSTITFDLATGGLTLPQDLTFQGATARIRGNFSGATAADQVAFQNSTLNGATNLIAIPNGTETTSIISLYNSSDPLNASVIYMASQSSTHVIRSSKTGAGVEKAINIENFSGLTAQFNTNGSVGFGVVNPNSTARVHSENGIDLGNSNNINPRVLDYYLEEDQLLTINGSVVAGSAVYAHRVCSMQRVGNRVHLQGSIEWSGHTGSGDMTIAGLSAQCIPANIPNGYSSGSLTIVSLLPALGVDANLSVFSNPGASFLSTNMYNTTTNARGNIPLCTSGSIVFDITYRVQ